MLKEVVEAVAHPLFVIFGEQRHLHTNTATMSTVGEARIFRGGACSVLFWGGGGAQWYVKAYEYMYKIETGDEQNGKNSYLET